MRTCKRLSSIAYILFLIAGAAYAQQTVYMQEDEYAVGSEKFDIRPGAFWPSFDTDIRLDTPTETGTAINMEDDLGLSDNTTAFRLDGYWRAAPRHRIGVTYYGLNRDGFGSADRDIWFGGTLLPAGAAVGSFFDSTIVYGKYMYSFILECDFELAGVLGISYLDFSTGIDSGDGCFVKSASKSCVTPAIGLDTTYRFADRWRLLGGFNFLSLGLGSCCDLIYDYNVGVEYLFTPNFGLGVGYAGYSANVDCSDDDFNGDLDYDFHGFMVFGDFRF